MIKDNSKTILTRGVEEVIEKKHLEAALSASRRTKKKLRVKFGIDPTSPDLHLGHMVPLRKLRQFQDAGHKVVLIIGDATAMVGDPSGRDKTRPQLTYKQIKDNYKKYLSLAGKVLDVKKIEVQHNGKWFNKKAAELIIDLAGRVTLHQSMHRADFKKRLKNNEDITFLEAMYPLWQGYDSVQVKADIEIGGTDQKFNLLMGRTLQKSYGQEPQDVVMTPLIEGTDGEKKMSKSYGNYIAIDEKPDQMFGKIMSIPDGLMKKYFETLTDLDYPRSSKPKTAKLLLAKTIVSQLHDVKKATQAMGEFMHVFSDKGRPRNLPSISISAKEKKNIPIFDLLVRAGVSSKSEARRLIEQGGVRIDGELKMDTNEKVGLKSGQTLQIGKKRYFKIK